MVGTRRSSWRERTRAARKAPRGGTALFVAFALTLSGVALAVPQARGKAAPRPRGPSYASSVKRWHEPVEGQSAPRDDAGRPMLALASLNTGDHATLSAASERGGFAAHDLDRAAFVLREPSSGNEHPLEPRLADLVYRIQTHFAAQEIRVISGYRTPRPGRGASNHGRGRAIDLIVPGTSDDEVAKFARELGFCGVGVYPHSGFVHVDVRDRSYFWIDASGPGKRNRARGVLGDVAKKSDEHALARGEHPLSPLTVANDVDAWLKARAEAPDTAPMEEDDDEESASR